MPRATSVYRCQQCGFATPKPGTCPDCKRSTGELVPLVEERAASAPGGRRAAAPAGTRPVRLADVVLDEADRPLTGCGQVDTVHAVGGRQRAEVEELGSCGRCDRPIVGR